MLILIKYSEIHYSHTLHTDKIKKMGNKVLRCSMDKYKYLTIEY